MEEGCDVTMRLMRETGFEQVTRFPSDGQPGSFATVDAGAPPNPKYGAWTERPRARGVFVRIGGCLTSKAPLYCGAKPKPARTIVWGLLFSASTMLINPLCIPAASGLKTTAMLHDVPAARLVGQLFS